MKTATFISTLLLTVFSTAESCGQSAWLPEPGQGTVTPGYSRQTFNRFLVGSAALSFPTELVQQNAFLTFDYGIAARWAADLTLGYAHVHYDTPGGPEISQDGLDDTRVGVRYQLLDERRPAFRGAPSLAIRAGGIVRGNYDVFTVIPPLNPGDRASGFEISLLAGRSWDRIRAGLYSELGWRVREDHVPQDFFGNIGVFKHLGPFTVNVGYRHVQSLTGGDILGPGFGTSFGFPQVMEINRLVEGGISFTDRGGRSYQITTSQFISGRNTGDKWILGASVTFPFKLSGD